MYPHPLKVLATSCPVSVQETKLKGSPHTWSLELLDLAGFLALIRTAVLNGPSGSSHSHLVLIRSKDTDLHLMSARRCLPEDRSPLPHRALPEPLL